MNQPFCDDKAYIAESFSIDNDYIIKMARLASFKIHSYKLSMVNAAFCATREELGGMIKTSLLNYTEPLAILSTTGFWLDEFDN
jgi:hypothetical protein